MIKKILCIVLSGVLAFSTFTILGFCDEEEMTINQYSSALYEFLDDNSFYTSSIPSPDSEEDDTNDISTNRLIVATIDDVTLSNYCDAVDVLEGYKNIHLLQYETYEDAISAYSYYSNQNYIDYVEFDELIYADDFVYDEISTYSSDTKTISWGSDTVESKRLSE